MARSAEVRNNFLCSSFQFRVVCCSMKLFSLNLFVFLVSRDEFPGAKLKVSSPVLFIFFIEESQLCILIPVPQPCLTAVLKGLALASELLFQRSLLVTGCSRT